MIEMKNFNAVIFDCDGVLVDSEVLAIKGECAALGALGLVYSAEEYVARFVGMHDRAFFDALRADHIERLGAPAPDNFEDRVLAGRAEHRDKLTAISGADAALIAARECVTSIAVASSSRSHFLESKLKRTDLWRLAAPHVYSADLVEHGKPAPDIFLYTAARLGVAPEKCLVIEDSRNGILAARAAGMAACGFTGGGHCYDGYAERLRAAGAYLVAPDFSVLVAAFKG